LAKSRSRVKNSLQKFIKSKKNLKKVKKKFKKVKKKYPPKGIIYTSRGTFLLPLRGKSITNKG